MPSIPEKSPFPLPPPRELRLPPAGFKVWLARLFFLPILAAGTVLAVQALLLLLLIPFGKTSTAIISKTGSPGTVGHEVQYTYEVAGRTYEGRGWVKTQPYNAIRYSEKPLVPVAPVKYLHVGPFRASEFADIPIPNDLGKLSLVSFALLVFACHLFYVAWLQRPRDQYLCTFGLAVPGTLDSVSRYAAVRFLPRFTAKYRFTSPEGQQLAGVRRVSRQVVDAFVPGAAITVLVHPRNPRRSLPLEAISTTSR